MMRKRWKIFADEYLKLWNATEAYSRAYPKCKRTTASTNGHLLLRNTEISAYIDAHLMQPQEIIGRLTDQARGVGEYFDPVTGELSIRRLIADGRGHLIKKQKKDMGKVEVELYDAQNALTLLGKHHKLFSDQVEMTGDITVKVIKGVSMDEL